MPVKWELDGLDITPFLLTKEGDRTSVRRAIIHFLQRDVAAQLRLGLAPREFTLRGAAYSRDDIQNLRLKALQDKAMALYAGRDDRFFNVLAAGFEGPAEEEGAPNIYPFALELLAVDPFEHSATLTTKEQTCTASPTSIILTNGGNIWVAPTIKIKNNGTAVISKPALQDADGRKITYDADLAVGEEIEITPDYVGKIGATDVSQKLTGEFPRIAAGGENWQYSDASASRTALVTITYRDRWY